MSALDGRSRRPISGTVGRGRSRSAHCQVGHRHRSVLVRSIGRREPAGAWRGRDPRPRRGSGTGREARPRERAAPRSPRRSRPAGAEVAAHLMILPEAPEFAGPDDVDAGRVGHVRRAESPSHVPHGGPCPPGRRRPAPPREPARDRGRSERGTLAPRAARPRRATPRPRRLARARSAPPPRPSLGPSATTRVSARRPARPSEASPAKPGRRGPRRPARPSPSTSSPAPAPGRRHGEPPPTRAPAASPRSPPRTPVPTRPWARRCAYVTGARLGWGPVGSSAPWASSRRAASSAVTAVSGGAHGVVAAS